MKRLHISQVDALFANGAYPIEFLFFYKGGVETGAVRRAFRGLATPYWPLFGRYAGGEIVFDGFREEACFDAGVRAETFDAGAPPQEIHERYRREIPPVMERLFFLKILQLANGTAVVARINHVAGDGYTYFSFLSDLAASARAPSGSRRHPTPPVPEPRHDRTVLRPFTLGDAEPEPLGDTGGSTLEFLEVPRLGIRNTIREIGKESGERVSTNDVLAALAIQRLAGVADPAAEGVELVVPIDVRREVKELGPRYVGNGLMFGRVPFRRSELAGASLERIAVAIRRGMPEVSTASYTRYLERLEEIIHARQLHRLRPYDPATDFLVTNLSRLPTDRLDFGSGTPDYVLPLTIGRNSAAVLGEGDRFVLRMEY